MKKISWCFLVLIFIASCGSTTEYCDLPKIPTEVVEEIESVDFSGTFEDCGTEYTIENTIDFNEAL